MEENITLRIWHGGLFKTSKQGKGYIGGEARTFCVDPDELCWWFLKEMVEKCGDYREINEIYYLIPGTTMEEGLKRVYANKKVLEMAVLALKSRSIDLFVVHGVHELEVLKTTQTSLPQPNNKEEEVVKKNAVRKCNTPKKVHKSTPTRCSPRHQKEVVQLPLCFSPENSSKPSQNTSKPIEDTLKTSQKTTCTPSPKDPLQPSQEKSNAHPKTTSQGTQHTAPKYTPATSTQKDPPEVTNLSPQVSHPPEGVVVDEEEYYKWYDNRPESPIPWKDLVAMSDGESSGNESLYEPETGGNDINEDSDSDWSELEEEFPVDLNDDVVVEADDSSDDELHEARELKRRTDAQLIDISQKVQREAEGGKGTTVYAFSPSQRVDAFESGYTSDYADSEGEEDTPDEDALEHGVERKQRRRLKVGAATDLSTFEWKVGQRFKSRESFRDAVAKFAIFQGRDVKISASNKNRGQRLEVKCKEGCKFSLYASHDAGAACFMVKSVIDGHTCVRNMEKNTQLKSAWLAKQLLEVFKARPHWPAKEIIDTVSSGYRVSISTDKAYKVKRLAHKMLHGSMREHYLKVGSYVELLKQTSPNSRVLLVVDNEEEPPVFQRIFICFDGVAKGWREACRRVLCIDACFLKTFLGGQLLVAVGRDGNDQMFPVAWAVVEGENNDSWEWFLNEVRLCLLLNDGQGIAIISDEHLSILAAVNKVLPQAEHRHCARHIYAHWHKWYRGDDYKQLFWRAVKAYNEADYNEALEDMRKVNPASVDAFISYNPRLFCRHLMSTETKVDVVVNNLAETFNGYIISARTKHLLHMLEEIRTKLMQRLTVKKENIEKMSGSICPTAKLKLENAKKLAADCIVIPSSASVFQVSEKMDVCLVDIEQRCCSCRVWDLTGIPCQHGVASIFFCRRNAEDYVSHWYSLETYTKSYAYPIPPCVGERQWPKVDLPLSPPPIKIGPGRPRKNRIKDPFENPKKPGKLSRHGLQMTCSICKQPGHNKVKCKKTQSDDVASQPKRQKTSDNTHAAGPSSGGVQIEGQTDESNAVLNATAHPNRTGRGGRVIRGGRGARGGRSTRGESARGGRSTRGGSARGGSIVGGRGTKGGRGSRGGRGRGQIPAGVGVLVSPDGTSIINPGLESQSFATVDGGPLGTQNSAAASTLSQK